jgi:glucose-6-phosphate isomerase
MLFCLDETDPDGFDLIRAQLDGQLDEKLVLVTSKSGGKPEARNGIPEMEHVS